MQLILQLLFKVLMKGKKKRKDLLKDAETETIAGFNQRPGGRVDMVLDDLQAVQNFDWPWAPAVKAGAVVPALCSCHSLFLYWN